MYKKAGLSLVIVLLLLLITGLFLTQEFEVAQSITLNATPADIHPYVNNLKHWPKWTPWKKIEPDMIIKYGDLTTGIGASQSWQGSGGNGHLHITASSPDSGIAFDIFFGKDTTPAISAIEYKILASNITQVSWRIHGDIDIPVLGGYIAIFVRRITSTMYQKGLTNLKTVVEKSNSQQ